MKIIISLIVLLKLTICSTLLAQELPMSKSKLQPELEIQFELWRVLDRANFKKCGSYMFSIKFELDKKSGHIKNLKFSENLLDTAIISCVRKALYNKESIWILKNCKKNNPSLLFLLPISIGIHKDEGACNHIPSSNFEDMPGVRESLDFKSMITFPKTEYATDSAVYKEDIFRVPKVKFVGMTLNPIVCGVKYK